MTPAGSASESARSIRAAQTGAGVNLVLAALKVAAGIFGHTYALIADGVESMADVVSSLIVWGGIAVGARPADDDHPFGHGKAESIAAAVVSFMLLLAAMFIAVESIKEIRTPHEFPAIWTLAVLLGVVLVKGVLSRRVGAIGASTGSAAVDADAMHHMSDALTSGAAFVGISAALLGRHYGGGAQWAAADDWAALAASLVIAYNGVRMFMTGLHDLMDRSPGLGVLTPLREAALAVPGVCDVEKLAARRVGVGYRVTVHVQASPAISLAEAHALGGRVKHAMLASGQRIQSVLVHMEPYDEITSSSSADHPAT
jgi:cation diffusion facilitator family transporter